MLGRPNCAEPVLAKSLAGAWLKTSVATDLTNVRSSTTSAMSRQERRDPCPRLAVPRELADRPQQLGMLLGENIHECESTPLDERIGDRLAAVLLKLGLVVEELELARSAGHEEIDHALGPRGEMAGTSRERVGARARTCWPGADDGDALAMTAFRRGRAGRSPSRSDARAMRPSPTPQSAKKCRRVRSRSARATARLASKSSVIAVPSSRQTWFRSSPITRGSRIHRGSGARGRPSAMPTPLVPSGSALISQHRFQRLELAARGCSSQAEQERVPQPLAVARGARPLV